MESQIELTKLPKKHTDQLSESLTTGPRNLSKDDGEDLSRKNTVWEQLLKRIPKYDFLSGVGVLGAPWFAYSDFVRRK